MGIKLLFSNKTVENSGYKWDKRRLLAYTVSMIRVFTSPSQSIGEKGEDVAVLWLKRQGYAIVDRNVSGMYGELDIIAKKKGIFYFFEVKSARVGSIVTPSENFSRVKLEKVLKTAAYYAAHKGIVSYRVMGVTVVFGSIGEPKVELLELW